MFERFSAAARATVVGAQQEARSLGHRHIGSEHLLLALLAAGPNDPSRATLATCGLSYESCRDDLGRLTGVSGLDSDALSSIGIDLAAIQQRMVAEFGPDALGEPEPRAERQGLLRRSQHLPFAADAKQTLEQALRAAVERGERQIGTGHLLLGVLRAGGLATRLLSRQGITSAAVRAELDRRLRDSA